MRMCYVHSLAVQVLRSKCSWNVHSQSYMLRNRSLFITFNYTIVVFIITYRWISSCHSIVLKRFLTYYLEDLEICLFRHLSSSSNWLNEKEKRLRQISKSCHPQELGKLVQIVLMYLGMLHCMSYN